MFFPVRVFVITQDFMTQINDYSLFLSVYGLFQRQQEADRIINTVIMGIG